MSWGAAKRIAREYSQLMLARIRDQERASGHRAGKIKLTDFEDDACYRFLKGPDAWTLEFHRMVTRACAREIKRTGYSPEIVTVHLPQYWSWLEREGVKDSTERRAAFLLSS